MNRTFIILFMLAGLSSQMSAQEKVNQTDEQGRKQGKWQKYHPGDTVLRYEGQFKDDAPFGRFTHYYPSGDVNVILTYQNANRCLSRSFYPSGLPMAIGPYENKLKDSTWILFDSYGARIAEEHYVMGKRYGDWKKFFPDGKLMEEKTFENDLEEGKMKQYFPSGMLFREAIFVEGGFEGPASFYHENGMVRLEGEYHRDAKEGIWKTYDENGELVDERMYRKGVPEERDSDLINDDTTKYIVKDVYTADDVFEEDYSEVPSKKQEKESKKKNKKK